MTPDDARRFDDDGYLVVRGLLDPRRDVDPVGDAFASLIDALATVYAAELGASSVDTGAYRSIGERLALLLGASGGDALHHLAPVLSVFSPRFRWRSDLPSAQVPELFALMRNPALLDAVEALVGPEIYASPIYHLNLKLAPRYLALADAIAREARRRSPSLTAHYGFEVARTPWHMDAIAGLRDSHASRIVVAWIPVTQADGTRGSLLLVPGSHRLAVRAGPFPEALIEQAVAIEAVPGDVVFMRNTLVHASTQNRSDEDVRWACNFRYLPVGEPNGRPYLPGFVARSRADPTTELTNPNVWAAMWTRALGNLMRGELPVPNAVTTSLAEADAITRRWRAAVPDVDGWLRLRRSPSHSRPVLLVRRVVTAVRRWAAARVSR